jgi:aspartyl-tRNA(Asn)/glutamyl-tRNA(Gln) amidotransferase subunit A
MSDRRISRRRVLAAGASAPLAYALGRRVPAAAGVGEAAVTSSNPADLTIMELLPLLEGRRLSAREALEACIERVERLDPEIKAFERFTFDVATSAAKAVDEARALGRPVGPLAGVPLGVKDMFFTKGIPTTGSSKVMEDFVPDYDATAWARLSAAGMVLVGKLSSTEFAYGTNSPPTVNPWDTQRSPGGSSGGSGASVSARMVPAALGGDTGASIIVPAAMCGISGLKATYGRVSRHGGFPLAWSLDHVGPMTRRMADSAVLLQVMAGHDPADPTTLQAPVPQYPTVRPPSLAGVRIGLPDRFYWEDVDAEVARVCREGLTRLAAMGAEIVDVPAPPSTDEVLGRGPNPYGSLFLQPLDVYLKIVVPEATSFHRRLAAERPHRYSPEILANIEFGETVSAADYLDAQRLRSVWVREWRELFASERLDAVASPAVPTEPTYQTPSQSFLFGPSFRLTKGFNVNGFPSVSVPLGLDNRGYPVGLQMAAAHLEEPRLLAIAIALDEDVRFFTRKPPILEGVK